MAARTATTKAPLAARNKARINPRESHPIFEAYPQKGTRTSWYGKVGMPYRVYNGFGALIGGTCDPTAARRLLRNERLQPVLTRDRRALMAVWIANFTESSVGPHTELQFSFFVSDRTVSDVMFHPFALLHAMQHRPEIWMMPHGLWNNNDPAVGFNQEMLALPASIAASAIHRTPGRLNFTFSTHDSAGNTVPVCSGFVREPRHTPLGTVIELGKLFGFSELMAQRRRPYLTLPMVNPIGDVLGDHVATIAAFNNDRMAVREWKPGLDELTIGHPLYAGLDFHGDFVETFDGTRFVYVTPAPLDHTLLAV
jgi:hypothetical protein